MPKAPKAPRPKPTNPRRPPRRSKNTPPPSPSPSTVSPFLIPSILTKILTLATLTPAVLASLAPLSRTFAESVAPLLWERVELGSHAQSMLFVRSLVEAVRRWQKDKKGYAVDRTFALVKSLSLVVREPSGIELRQLRDWAKVVRAFNAPSSRASAVCKDPCKRLEALRLEVILQPVGDSATYSLPHSHWTEPVIGSMMDVASPRRGPLIFRLVCSRHLGSPKTLIKRISTEWFRLQRLDLCLPSCVTCLNLAYFSLPSYGGFYSDSLNYLSRLFERHDTVPLIRLIPPSERCFLDHLIRHIINTPAIDRKRFVGRIQVIGDDGTNDRLRSCVESWGGNFDAQPVYKSNLGTEGDKAWWETREGQVVDEEEVAAVDEAAGGQGGAVGNGA